MTESVIDKCIVVLQMTRDGNDLAPKHLYLIQTIVNASRYGVHEELEATFESLYQDVVAGRYDKSKIWLHGIEHLTKDHEGYVYWRGRQVEHYSFRNREEEAKAAGRLANACLSIERRAGAVTLASVLDELETIPR